MEDSLTSSNKINTNIEDYNIEELFNLLSIKIDENTDYDELKERININSNTYIEHFESLNKKDLVDFFKNVKSILLDKNENEQDIDNNISENERLLINTGEIYNAEKNRGIITKGTDTTDDSLYNSSKGAGNPINRKTITKLLNIDSKFRENYQITSPTDYKIDLPYPINNVIEMKLSDLEFPTTYYPFNDAYENNYFWVKVTQGSGAEIFIYVYIPEGNYYQDNFISLIQSAFDELGVELTIKYNLSFDNDGGIGVGDGTVVIGIGDGNNITNIGDVELNFSGRKLTTDIENYNKSQKFLLDFEEQEEIINNFYYQDSLVDYKSRIGWMMGYRKDFYTGQTAHTTESVLDIIGSKYMFLIVDDFNNSSNINYLTSSKNSLLPDNILARISIKGYAFSVQSQTDLSIYTEPRYYYGPVNIEKLHIKVVDEYGRIVDLNNSDFSFTLNLITIYSNN